MKSHLRKNCERNEMKEFKTSTVLSKLNDNLLFNATHQLVST